MLIKGPMIRPGSTFDGMASMVDLAPTMLELAAGGNSPDAVPGTMDGSSFAPMLTEQGSRQWKEAVLIEYQSIRVGVEMLVGGKEGEGGGSLALSWWMLTGTRKAGLFFHRTMDQTTRL
jgi:hypothetical protein